MNVSERVKKATTWSMITEICSKIITPIVNMVLARLLVPEAFGVVATINMVISFAEIFTDAGFQKFLIQREFESEDDLNRSTDVAFWTNLGLSCFICVVIFFARHSLATMLKRPELANSISIASILIIVAAFSSIQMARYKRNFDFKTLFVVRLGVILIPVVVTIPLAIVLKNYWALLIGTFASQLFNAIVLTVKSKWKPKFFYSVKLLKKMFGFSAWTILESISIWLTLNVGIFIVGNNLNDYYLGLYTTSITTVNSIVGIITSSISPVLFSALSRHQNDDLEYRKTYYSFQRMSAVFIVPLSVGIFLYSDLVTLILLGNQWAQAAGAIGIAGLFRSVTFLFSNFSSEVYRSKGEPRISLIMQIVYLVFIIPVLWISSQYGFKPLYISNALAGLEMVLCSVIIMRYRYKFRFLDSVKEIYPMFIASLIMGGCGYLLKTMMDNVIWSFVTVIICMVVYFLVLFLFFPRTRIDASNFPILGKFFKKIFKS